MTAAARTTAVWAGLSAITVVSWFLAPAHHAEPVTASTAITIAVLTLALIKTRLIIGEFMEVRTAPVWLKLATDGWLVVLFGAIMAIYLW
ncbi:MAG TPA: cytochrome C oxidase subunit IV family protein [Mycobacterium sp.]